MLTNPQRKFISLMQQNAENVAQALMYADEVASIFLDRGYDEVDSVTDEDLAEYGITRADIAAYIDACQQLVNLRDGIAVTQGDYGAAINSVRLL